MTSSLKSASRRLFMRQTAALSALGAGAPLALNLAAMGSAAAQSATGGDYKALVCIFLAGGNDAFNTLLATDSTSWNAYTTTRNQQPSSIALPQEGLMPLSPVKSLGGRSVALHPQLGGLQNMFNTQRRLSVVANVGPMVDPLSKDDYLRQLKRVPSKLFSHNDQQSTWQSLAPEGASKGWGGRMAELLTASSPNGNNLFTGISAAGNAVWVSGNSVKQYQIQPSGVLRMGLPTVGVEQIYGSTVVASKIQEIAQRARNRHAFEADVAEVGRRSIEADKTLRLALPSELESPYGPENLLYYTKPTGGLAVNPLAKQLQAVARTMGARTTLGMKRQVFFVSLGGFDTHDNQLTRHADLMAQLNHAMVYFDNVMTAMGLGSNVTTFTASDFGRTFTSNGDGTDHGWGGHQFVMGGAVRGGVVAGNLPIYSTKNTGNNYFDGSADQLLNGALLPSTSVEHYGSALGKWFGLSDTQIADVFPNLARQGSRDLGII